MQQFLLAANGDGGMMGMLPMFAIMIAIFYFLIIRPQKKREKQAKEMREALEIGDEVLAAGGIIGRVVSISKDNDSILIESGSANTKLRIAKAAIQTNITSTERLRERQAEAAKAAAEERDRKKGKKSKDEDTSAADEREKELQKKLDQ